MLICLNKAVWVRVWSDLINSGLETSANSPTAVIRFWLETSDRAFKKHHWIHQCICLRTQHVTLQGNSNTSTYAIYYLPTSAAILSMTVTALLISLSPIASEGPCSSAVCCRRLSVICSLQETTCKHAFNAFVCFKAIAGKSGMTGCIFLVPSMGQTHKACFHIILLQVPFHFHDVSETWQHYMWLFVIYLFESVPMEVKTYVKPVRIHYTCQHCILVIHPFQSTIAVSHKAAGHFIQASNVSRFHCCFPWALSRALSSLLNNLHSLKCSVW